MRTLSLCVVLGFVLAGCDAGSDSGVTARLVNVSGPTSLSAEAQAVVDQGGTLIWEVQSELGRRYASQETLPALVPGAIPMLVVLADVATCTPKCTPLGIARFEAPSDGLAGSATAAGDFSIRLDFEQ
ncbi:MAG: hypothetical protein AAFN13_08150 [Bacteroidota bacterium]